MNLKEYIPYYQRNLKIALPIMITQAGQVLVQLADNIMVGHLGATELAGVSFANAVFMIGFVFSVGFPIGITPLVGQCFGKKQHDKIAGIFSNAMVLNFLVGILVTAIMGFVGSQLHRMGQNEDVLFHAMRYYKVMLITYIPTMLFFSIRHFSDGIGNTKNAMWITLSVNAINIFLNWVLIYGKFGIPAYGVAGAAIATLISRIIALFIFIYLLFKLDIYRIYIDKIKAPFVDSKNLKEILGTSLPISLQNLAEITAFSFTTIMVGWMGKYELAAHEIAHSLGTFVFMIAIGIGSAATIRVSHQYGSGNYIGVKMAGTAAIHMTLFMMGCTAILFICFHNYIPHIYTPDINVHPIASDLIIVLGLFQLFDALQLSSMASLRGLKDIKIPLIYSTIAYYLVCLPLGYLLGFTLNLGPVGVWIGLLFGLLTVGIFFWLRFNKLSNRLISQSLN